MADKPADKKGGDKKAAPSAPSFEQTAIVFGGIFVLIFLVVIPAVLSALNIEISWFNGGGEFKETFIGFVAKLFTTVTFISIFASLLFIVLLSYAILRKNQVLDAWNASRATLSTPLAGQQFAMPNLPGASQGIHGPTAQGGNEQWLDIEQKINSANPSDWRLAILEADIVLFDMLDQMGLPGKDLGEKLKSADSSFFSTLDEAWKAHKIRNVIAHEGTAYNLSYNEARRAIDMYRRVFEEFYFI